MVAAVVPSGTAGTEPGLQVDSPAAPSHPARTCTAPDPLARRRAVLLTGERSGLIGTGPDDGLAGVLARI